MLEGGDDIAKLPQYYFPYTDAKDSVIQRLAPLTTLESMNPLYKDRYDEMIEKYQGRLSEVGYLPLQGRLTNLVAIVDKSTAEVIEIVKLKPWP